MKASKTRRDRDPVCATAKSNCASSDLERNIPNLVRFAFNYAHNENDDNETRRLLSFSTMTHFSENTSLLHILKLEGLILSILSPKN